MNIDPLVQSFILEAFEINFAELSEEAGHSLAAAIKEEALRQVFSYYLKLKKLAESVTETEVKLSLTGQRTPSGRTYALEGVVDIINEGGRIMMYDLKTHSSGEVLTNRERYRDQLNVYAHIYQSIQKKRLNGTAVIATRLPRELSQALKYGEEERIANELEHWQPIVDIPFDEKNVQETIDDFSHVVDGIEERQWDPRPTAELSKKWEGKIAFGTAVCRNCDTRFSCSSYRRWVAGSDRPREFSFLDYIADPGMEEQVENWRDSMPVGELTPENAELEPPI